MNIAVVSFFRNSTSYLPRFFNQVNTLRNATCNSDKVRLIAVEGDSRDKTHDQLQNYCRMLGNSSIVVPRDHGKREFGSTEEHDRLETLSWVGNGGLENVWDTDDLVLYVESDLIWKAGTVISCLQQVHEGVDIVSPLVFAGDHFYDVFCFRSLDGQRFAPFPPYSHSLRVGLNEVGSVGSCLCMRAEVARNVRIPGAEVLIGFCRVAREKGYRIFVDTTQRIQHP